jgi:hypothetical protein
MSYDNTNSGIITRNDKQGNEKRPDYRGSINVEGRDYWLSAWIKTGRDGTKLAGQKYMSLSVEPKEASAASVPAPSPWPSPAPAPSMSSYGTGDYTRAPAAPPAAARHAPAPAPKTSGTGFDDMDDDIPF